MIDSASGLSPLIRALRSVVITSAIAPSGCTTMSGANDERGELADDREAEHDGAEHPRRPGQQASAAARR